MTYLSEKSCLRTFTIKSRRRLSRGRVCERIYEFGRSNNWLHEDKIRNVGLPSLLRNKSLKFAFRRTFRTHREPRTR